MTTLDWLHRADRPALAEALRAYYAPDAPGCGTCFLDGTEAIAPDTMTAADLFAVTTLGVSVAPPLARRLLRDTAVAGRVAAHLARLPLDATLDTAGPALLNRMSGLHTAVLAAVDPRPRPRITSRVLASALCARKRPELFPVLDVPFCATIGTDPTAPLPSWLAVRELLRRPEVADALADVFARAGAHGPVDVYPLRQLYVLTCLASIAHLRLAPTG